MRHLVIMFYHSNRILTKTFGVVFSPLISSFVSLRQEDYVYSSTMKIKICICAETSVAQKPVWSARSKPKQLILTQHFRGLGQNLQSQGGAQQLGHRAAIVTGKS